MFAVLLREARAWLKQPTDERLNGVHERSLRATPMVPDARKADWEKLIGGFARPESDAKRRARVEGLVRACAMFSTKPPPPLEWSDPVDRLKGIGGITKETLGAIGVRTVFDMVWCLPIRFDDLKHPTRLRDLPEDPGETRYVVRGTVTSSSALFLRGRRSVRVVLDDEGSKVHLWWFFAAHGVLTLAKEGTRCIAIGKIRRDGKKPLRMAHPDILREDDQTVGVRPRYSKLGVGEAIVRKAVAEAVTSLRDLPDPVPPAIRTREAMGEAPAMLRAVHAPSEVPSDDMRRALAERLAWAEAFTRVWERLESESRTGGAKAKALPKAKEALTRLRAEFGFPLTRGQNAAIAAIEKDLTSPTPMRRLLLGDVGTGKTAVALAAAAQAVAAKTQVAILAPTGVLAEQYMDAVGPLARATHARIVVVTGAMSGEAKRVALAAIQSGKIDVVVGTHALLEDKIVIPKLSLVVVDEQQRLGVAQRLALVAKGVRPHLLTLTATPIPRTLALALRGELVTSVLDERPKGRPPVATRTAALSEWERIQTDIRATCERGERVFVIVPRIESIDDEEAEEAGAIERFSELAAALNGVAKVGLVHGQLHPNEKRQAMVDFRSGATQVLVGTTVLEVGIDVPEATLMVIHGAERFGLAQLHQIRGRVGRGRVPGRCIAVHEDSLEGLAKRRLEAFCRLDAGFEIAKADLELRGAGDLGGTRQSGNEEDLLFLDPTYEPPWLPRVAADAARLFNEDRAFTRPEHRALALAVARMRRAIAVREEAG